MGPLRPQGPSDPADPNNVTAGLTERETTNGSYHDSLPARILVIDDSPSDQRLIREVLIESGILGENVMSAGSLTEARKALSERTPDCILLDLSLPDAFGLEAVTIMAAAAPEIPVVVVTGRQDDLLVYAAMAEGADEYLTKSDMDVSKLQDVLLRASQRRRGGKSKLRKATTASLVLDSIDAPTVAVDGSGRIVAINRAWEQTAVEADTDISAVGVGVNYLTVCDQAVGPFSEGAAELAAGLRSVLHGEAARFVADYPFRRGERDGWFSVRVTPVGELGGGAVLTHLDITHLKTAELQLRLQEAQLHSIFDESAPIFALADRDGVIQHVSETTTALLGVRLSEEIGTQAFSHVEPSDVPRAQAAFRRVLNSPGQNERLEMRIRDGQGRWRVVDLAITNLLEDPKVQAVAITGCDVTEGRFNQIARRLENRLLQSLPAAVVVTDERDVIVYWNDRATTMYGHQAHEVLGRPITEFSIVPRRHEMVRTTVPDLADEWEGDFEAVRADGTLLPVHITIDRVNESEIGFHGLVAASVDVSERRRLEDDLAFQAMHDPVTELPNRRMFVRHLEDSLARSNAGGKRTGVIFIDLDDFKLINDRIGHVGGDHVLRMVGSLVAGTLRRGDIVARIGGDEFVVCCDDVDGPETAQIVADRIISALSVPFEVENDTAATSASIGIALSGPESTAEGLLRHADIAMYAAKQNGKARLEVFDDALHVQTRVRNELAMELDRAIELGEIKALFQPVVSLTDSTLVGFEALARWPHPGRGMIPPDEFIPIAEECGLIGHLGRTILEYSCQALRSWLDDVPDRPVNVAVNVSAQQLSDPKFPDLVRSILLNAGVPASQLCLEVTESTLVEADVAATALRKLKDTGVDISIDDFGTGYSSLNRIRQFPLDYLKIDRSFVAGMSGNKKDDVIIGCVLALASGLEVHTIAEGVEDLSQLTWLGDAGCEMAQGWLWSPAVPWEKATELVRSRGPVPFAPSVTGQTPQ
jgi:diguanylate cyclase (GGDEF)-like protein/PAS domain S-box-containing protein